MHHPAPCPTGCPQVGTNPGPGRVLASSLMVVTGLAGSFVLTTLTIRTLKVGGDSVADLVWFDVSSLTPKKL